MLILRRGMIYADVPLADKLSQEVMTNIDVFEFEFDTGSFESCKAPWLSSKIGKHGIPLPGIMKRQACLKINNFFTASPRATYSASEVERVTHFCVLENQHTHAPAHIIVPSDTDLLSVA